MKNNWIQELTIIRSFQWSNTNLKTISKHKQFTKNYFENIICFCKNTIEIIGNQIIQFPTLSNKEMNISFIPSFNKHLPEQNILQSILVVVLRPLHSIVSKKSKANDQSSMEKTFWSNDEVLIASWEFTSMCQLEMIFVQCSSRFHFVNREYAATYQSVCTSLHWLFKFEQWLN